MIARSGRIVRRLETRPSVAVIDHSSCLAGARGHIEKPPVRRIRCVGRAHASSVYGLAGQCNKCCMNDAAVAYIGTAADPSTHGGPLRNGGGLLDTPWEMAGRGEGRITLPSICSSPAVSSPASNARPHALRGLA